MRLDVSRLRGGEEYLDRRYAPGDFALDGEDFRLIAPVTLVATVRKDGRKVRVVGRVTATLETECSRCLEAFPIAVDTAVDVMFLPAPEPETAAPVGSHGGDGKSDGRPVEVEREVSEDDLGVSFYSDETLELGDLMREQFFLALPMKPLCREDCRGLCAVCGINRNRETCTCKTEWVDPRLEVLRQFKREN